MIKRIETDFGFSLVNNSILKKHISNPKMWHLMCTAIKMILNPSRSPMIDIKLEEYKGLDISPAKLYDDGFYMDSLFTMIHDLEDVPEPHFTLISLQVHFLTSADMDFELLDSFINVLEKYVHATDLLGDNHKYLRIYGHFLHTSKGEWGDVYSDDMRMISGRLDKLRKQTLSISEIFKFSLITSPILSRFVNGATTYDMWAKNCFINAVNMSLYGISDIYVPASYTGLGASSAILEFSIDGKFDTIMDAMIKSQEKTNPFDTRMMELQVKYVRAKMVDRLYILEDIVRAYNNYLDKVDAGITHHMVMDVTNMYFINIIELASKSTLLKTIVEKIDERWAV